MAENGEKYAGLVDKRAYLQVLGGLIQNPLLLDDTIYPLDKTDFSTEKFYSIIFVSIYNLFQQNVEKIDEYAIDSYLSSYPEQYKIFQDNDGLKWVSEAIGMAQIDNFDYYFHRVKKFALLRYYESNGLDTRFLYNGNILDSGEEQRKFDEMTEQEMIDTVADLFVIKTETKYCGNQTVQAGSAGDGLVELILEYREEPDYGFDMASPATNTLCRGSRKGTLTLIGACSGVGKSKRLLMEAAHAAVPYVWDTKKKQYVYTGHCTPTLYYGIEQTLKDYKVAILAHVSGVNAAHIKKNTYEADEYERVLQAAEYIKDAPLELIHCDDYTIKEVENTVKQYVNKKGVEIFLFDYIQNTNRLISEEAMLSRIKLQEYQILIEFSRRLKVLAERLDIAIWAAAQLKPETKDARYKDESCLQGAKALINKIDNGIILAKPRPSEMEKVKKITAHMVGCPEINLLQWFFKIRDGELTAIIVASHMDLGTLTIRDMFVTDYDFNLIDIDFTKIEEVREVVTKQARELKIELEDPMEDADENDEEEEREETKKRDFDW